MHQQEPGRRWKLLSGTESTVVGPGSSLVVLHTMKSRLQFSNVFVFWTQTDCRPAGSGFALSGPWYQHISLQEIWPSVPDLMFKSIVFNNYTVLVVITVLWQSLAQRHSAWSVRQDKPITAHSELLYDHHHWTSFFQVCWMKKWICWEKIWNEQIIVVVILLL